MTSNKPRWVAGMAAAAAVLLAVTATPAHAAGWGGDGDPQGCAGAYTARSAPIYGTRGATKGVKIGEVQLRWSTPCYAAWSKVVLYGNTFHSPATVEQRIESEGRRAGVTDSNLYPWYVGTSTWTPYLRLRDYRSLACAYASVSSDFDTVSYHTNGAHVCA